MIAIGIYAVQTLKGQCEGLANPLVKHECYCHLELKGTVWSLTQANHLVKRECYFVSGPKISIVVYFFLRAEILENFFYRSFL